MRPHAYSLKTNAFPRYFAAVAADLPEVFDTAHMMRLGFRFHIDYSLIDILKELGFLSREGTPTPRYREFVQGARADAILSEGIRSAYADLLAAYPDAFDMPEEDLYPILQAQSQGANNIALAATAKTFVALCALVRTLAQQPETLHHLHAPTPPAPQPSDDATPSPALSVAASEAASPGALSASPAHPESLLQAVATRSAMAAGDDVQPSPECDSDVAFAAEAQPDGSEAEDKAMVEMFASDTETEIAASNGGIVLKLPESSDPRVYDAIFSSLIRHFPEATIKVSS